MCIPAQPERIQQLARESETTSGHLHFKQKTLLKQAQILMTPPFQTIRQKEGGGSESESDHEQDKPLPADYPRKSISQPAGKSCITFRKSYSDIQPYFLKYITIRLEGIHFTKRCMKFIQNYK